MWLKNYTQNLVQDVNERTAFRSFSLKNEFMGVSHFTEIMNYWGLIKFGMWSLLYHMPPSSLYTQ